MILRKDWKYHGLPGHFCCSRGCIFRLHTTVGRYKISTVGAMYGEDSDEMQPIGLKHHYETMVFDLDVDEANRWSEIEVNTLTKGRKESPYISDKRAEAMHDEMCVKYAIMQEE